MTPAPTDPGTGRTHRGWPPAARVALAAALAAVLALSVWFTSGFGLWSRSAVRGPHRPNLVLILTDDQRWDTLSTMPEVRSVLVDHGVTFENSFVTTSLCCPSRASILTGQYSHTTGVVDGSPRNGAPAFRDRSTVAVWLHDAGYTTGLVGKYLNGFGALPRGYVPPGWDEWDAIAQKDREDRYYGYELDENGDVVRYGNDPADYTTAVLQGKAVSFIRETRSPFFLYFAPIAPHAPSIPAPGDAGKLANLPPLRSPSFGEADVSDKPQGGSLPPFTAEQSATIRSQRERALESLLAVDRAVSAIYEAVAARGELDDTYFLFTSDNGFLWGEHRLVGKIWPYEESIRVPLVIRVPGLDRPRTDEHMALNIDLAPTLAQLAGVKPGLPQDGRSLVPLLVGKDPPWRAAFIEEFLGYSPTPPPTFVAIRTVRYMYAEYDNGWRELYDLRTDPYELRNIVDDPRERKVRVVLAKRLHALLQRSAGTH